MLNIKCWCKKVASFKWHFSHCGAVAVRAYFTVSQGNVTEGIWGNCLKGDGNTGQTRLLWVVLQATLHPPPSEARECESESVTSSFWAEPIRAEIHWDASQEQRKLQILLHSYILAHIRAHIHYCTELCYIFINMTDKTHLSPSWQ